MIELQKRRLIKNGNGGDRYVYCKDVFNEHKCIFVGVPRAASSSISRSLFGNYAGGHTTARQYRRIFGPHFYRYFKFGFVRNPYSRLVSAYSYLKEGGHPAWPHDRIFQERINEACHDFSTFVDLFVRRPKDPEHVLMHPQTYYTNINQKMVLDFVGCIERIGDSFNRVKRKLGLSTAIPKMNESKKDRMSVASAYQKQKTVDAVKRRYKEDFRCFGYSVDLDSVGRPPEIYLKGSDSGAVA
jgi:hypothetical protein